MKIVDTFLYNNEYERDVLLAKLYAEYNFVNEIIGIESAYDFRGNHKGLSLKQLINKDTAFEPFCDKLTVIQNEKSPFDSGWEKIEKNYFKSEFISRGLAHQYLVEHYKDDDWVILSDVDEMLDFSNTDRRSILMDGFYNQNVDIQWQNLKFWWDFDNLNFNPYKYIPCHKLGFLKENGYANRNDHCRKLEPALVCGLEYAYCFSEDGNWNKLNTFAHDKYKEETLDNALLLNVFHKEKLRGEQLEGPLDFFETIRLDNTNSTQYVLDNLDNLKVNTVNVEYGQERMSRFNIYPHPCEQYNLLRGFKINRSYHYFRRSQHENN